MLPGKKYVPEDFLMMAWKRKWLLIIPTVLVSVGTFFYARQLPDVYEATTTILVIPQRVPTDYVRPTVTTRLDDRLNSIQQRIMTRTRLEGLIRELNLYREEREAGEIMEDIVQRMRNDIRVTPAGPRRVNTDAFMIRFRSKNPRTAVDVVSKLSTQFINENMSERTAQADATSNYLETEMNSARLRLLEHERKLQDYKQKFAGQLPSQVESNLSMLTQTQTRLSTLTGDMARDRDRLLQLEAEAANLSVNLAVAPPPPPAEGGAFKGTAAQQLAQAQAELKRQLQRYGPEWPSVVQLQTLIGDLEKKAEAEALAQPVSIAAGTRPLSPAEARLQSIQQELQKLRTGLEQKQQTEGQLQERLRFYTGRLEAIPGREAELVDLMRDYPIVQQAYQTLARQSEEAKRAANLERLQGGEQFKSIDSARLPDRPIAPDRNRLMVIGTLAGLGFGALIVGLLEYRDTSLKTDTDVSTTLALPVLAVIPVKLTDGDRLRAKRRRRAAMFAAATVVLLAVAAVVEWQFDIVRGLVR